MNTAYKTKLIINVKAIETIQFLAIVVFASLALTGCGDNSLRDLSSRLANTGTGASQKVASFYSKLNEAHRDMYAKELAVEKDALPIDLQERQRSGLINKYSNEYIELRVKTADLIEGYSAQIDKVVNSKKMDEAEQGVKTLNNKLGSILAQVEKMRDISSAWSVSSLTSLATPLTTLADLGVGGVFRSIKSCWAKKTIEASDKNFSILCDRLKTDLENDAGDAKQRATRLAGLYKRSFDIKIKKEHTNAERQKWLNELTSIGVYQAEIAENCPDKVFEDVKDIYHQLAQWAADYKPLVQKLKTFGR